MRVVAHRPLCCQSLGAIRGSALLSVEIRIFTQKFVYSVYYLYICFIKLKQRHMKRIKITTGTYNTSDYRVVKEYVRQKAALKFLNSHGYPFNYLDNYWTWNFGGLTYRLSVDE